MLTRLHSLLILFYTCCDGVFPQTSPRSLQSYSLLFFPIALPTRFNFDPVDSSKHLSSILPKLLHYFILLLREPRQAHNLIHNVGVQLQLALYEPVQQYHRNLQPLCSVFRESQPGDARSSQRV